MSHKTKRDRLVFLLSILKSEGEMCIGGFLLVFYSALAKSERKNGKALVDTHMFRIISFSASFAQFVFSMRTGNSYKQFSVFQLHVWFSWTSIFFTAWCAVCQICGYIFVYDLYDFMISDTTFVSTDGAFSSSPTFSFPFTSFTLNLLLRWILARIFLGNEQFRSNWNWTSTFFFWDHG